MSFFLTTTTTMTTLKESFSTTLSKQTAIRERERDPETESSQSNVQDFMHLYQKLHLLFDCHLCYPFTCSLPNNPIITLTRRFAKVYCRPEQCFFAFTRWANFKFLYRQQTQTSLLLHFFLSIWLSSLGFQSILLRRNWVTSLLLHRSLFNSSWLKGLHPKTLVRFC